MKMLSDLQSDFFRAVFCIGKGCPLGILYFDTKGTLMQNRIIKKKLLFEFHIENLPFHSLANEVYSLMKSHDLPGLYQECKELRSELGLGSISNYTKKQYKLAVSSKLDEKNHREILDILKQYKKINYDEIKDETFEVKSYLKSLSLPQARLRMRLRAGMVGSVKFNFQSDKKFTEVNWRCSCGQIDSQ